MLDERKAMVLEIYMADATVSTERGMVSDEASSWPLLDATWYQDED